MKPLVKLATAALLAALLAPGCSAKKAPLDGNVLEGKTPVVQVPLDVQDFKVLHADGHRGVLLKLSRLPDSVRHSDATNPARIVLEIGGPTGGESPVESFPSDDALVYNLRVSRSAGVLRVELDLSSDQLPPYSVHTMADYVMVRFDASGPS
jgi:hypothetical protein